MAPPVFIITSSTSHRFSAVFGCVWISRWQT